MWPPAIASVAPVALLALAAAVVAAAGAVRAEESAPAGGGALHLTADPPRLVLGRDDGAELRVAAPPHVEEISFTASAGRIESVRKLPGGGFAARFRAPPERVPQVAIVAAVARAAGEPEDGWIAIPLSGEGNARVRADPGAEVTLRIGDRTFGPRTAGPDGVAVVPVIVPPGVREAHQGFRPIDLKVPETSLLHAVQDRTIVKADREERVRVLAYVVAPHGVARRGDLPLFEPTRGTVAVSEREPGAFRAVWTLPPGPAGEERLIVRLAASTPSRAVVRATAVAGPPALVAVSFDRDALVAGGDPVGVIARALDAAGNQVPAELTLSARGAALSHVEERRPGELGARATAPDELGNEEAVVIATAGRLGISGSRAIPLRPGPPAAARFRPREAVVRSDGAREAILRLAVEDRFGNGVSAQPVVTAARGRVLGVEERARGEYAVRYVGAAVAEPAPDELLARVGAVRATAAPLLAPPGPAALVSARAGLAADVRGRFGGGSAGVVAQRPADVAFAVRRGAEVSWRVEAEGLHGRGGDALAAVLAGAGVRRRLGGSLEVEAALAGGAVLVPGGGGLAARAAGSVGLTRRWGVPHLELSLLGARAGAPGPFAAVGLSAGVRFGLEDRHGNDPDRR
jgi:hypothetical protein